MPPWNLTAGSPLSLNLAADARLAKTDYTDDQIWELNLGGGEPAALALETTYGLRAQRVRLFPRFISGDVQRTDPAGFHLPPRIYCFYPNYLAVLFAPFDGLEVVAEYWLPESQVAAGRLRLTNNSILPLTFRLELAGLLVDRDRQGGFAPLNLGASQALSGETGNIQPVVFLTGAPQVTSGPFPALALDLEMYPGNLRIFTWAAAGLRDQQQSLETARSTTARGWDAESTFIEMQHHSQSVIIETGDAELDAAFALAQKSARELFLQNALNLPHPSFVLTRRPDQGYSPRGDGADYPLPWTGQTAFDALYLASLLLPGAPHLAAGVVRNFLSVQEEDGRIDWRPGLGGQRTRRLAQPLIATLAAQIGPYLAAPGNAGIAPGVPVAMDWYREVYPGLLRFFQAWFLPERDADGDGIPEWENSLQSGLEESPVFDRFAASGRGIDASRLESPALMAMLLRECQSLTGMAEALGAEDDLPALQCADQRLRAALDECWDATAGSYRYRDYTSHLSLAGMSVVSFVGNGTFATKRRFKQPRRLVIRLDALEERTYAAVFTVYGYTAAGEASETLAPRSFAWLGTQAHAVTDNTYLAIERIEVEGIGKRDQVRIFAPDLTQEDCSLLLPLWAGAASPERARQIIETNLLPRFRQPYGIPVAPGVVNNVSIPWNHLLGECLLRYGYRAEAANLVQRLMSAVLPTLKSQQAFRQAHHAETGQPSGERGHLHGFAPVGLYLQVLGIRHLDTHQVLLDGFNPTSSPVTVKYRKVQLICHPDRTEITFAGGQTVVVDQPGPHHIVLANIGNSINPT